MSDVVIFALGGFVASSRRMIYPHVSITTHIIRFTLYVCGYGDSVFQTHNISTFFHNHTHNPLRSLCARLLIWRLPDASIKWINHINKKGIRLL